MKQVPVKWYEIEQEISGAYLFQHRLERKSGEMEGKRIAVVGAGPAGIAATVWLFEMGGDVHLYDANPRMGGVLRYGIPAFRLDKKYCDAYEKMFKKYCDAYEKMFADAGISFHGNVEVGKEVTLKALSAQYDAVLVAAGAETPATLGIPGEENSVQALPFLKNPEAFTLGKKVIVIGGGNVAMDACRTAVRRGAETWVYYRKTFENMPANPMEVEEAKADGVQFKVFQAPVEVKEGGVVFCDCENVQPEDGSRVITRIIITAISEKPDPALREEAQGLRNVWLCGDFLTGPATVVAAVASARSAVEEIKTSL